MQILLVDISIGLSQPFPSVVGWVAVLVVDHVNRPFARHVEMGESMAEVQPVIDSNAQIPFVIRASSNITDPHSIAC
jgi:hypothetical protein